MARKKRRSKLFLACRKCNRELTDSESQERGYGPVCWGKIPAIVTKQLEQAGQLRFPSIP